MEIKIINPKIGLDLDGVIANFHQKLLEVYNQKYGANLTVQDIDCELEKLGPDIYHKVIEIFNEPNWFLNLEPLPDAIALVTKFLDLEYLVTIVTAPARDLHGWINPASAAEKYVWLQKNLPFWSTNAIITKHKEVVAVDILIDDTGHNIVNWCREHPSGVGYLVDQSWNRSFKGLPKNAVRGPLSKVADFIEKYWCKERGNFIFRYDELSNDWPK